MGGLLPLVLYLALLQCHAAEGLLKTSSACFGQRAAPCARLSMTCSGQGKVFVVAAQYGSKPKNASCQHTVSAPSHCRDGCCRASAHGDCMRNYTASHFRTLFHTCREENVCRTSADRSNSNCGVSYITASGFVRASFVCIEDANVTQVEVGSSTSFSTGAAAAVRFSQGQQWNSSSSSSSSGEWRCLVESRSGSSSGGSTELLLVRGPGSSGGGPGAVDSTGETTPFYINLSELQVPETWAVMYASEGTSLQVTCGSSVTPDSSVTSDAPSSNAGTIAAVVISVLVLLAVAAVLVLVLMRRRGIKPSSLLSRLPRFKGGNSSEPARSPRPVKRVEISAPVMQDQRHSSDQKHHLDDVEDGEYFTIDDVDGDRPTVEGTGSTDYDRLGENKMASAPSRPHNPYGQLGATSAVNDVTEYNYNHLARDKRSDVIGGSDYDTARPPAGPGSDNSGYDVAVVKGGNRVEVLDSPPEVAVEKGDNRVKVLDSPPEVAVEKGDNRVEVLESPPEVAVEKGDNRVEVLDSS